MIGGLSLYREVCKCYAFFFFGLISYLGLSHFLIVALVY